LHAVKVDVTDDDACRLPAEKCQQNVDILLTKSTRVSSVEQCQHCFYACCWTMQNCFQM